MFVIFYQTLVLNQMKFFLILFFSINTFLLFAQRETAIWYFGNGAGLDFNSGNPIALNDSTMNTIEGCSTISDSDGNLLFYTDGTTVYNRNHLVMLNGNGLLGNASSTCSSIVIPYPQHENQYYVFTVHTSDYFYSLAQGLNYSIVDMSLDSGLGGIIPSSKNTNLLPITSEKLTATRTADGSAYWVISHFENKFYAYMLTNSGLSTPVISELDPFVELISTTIFNTDVVNMRGYVKVNLQGNKLAIAHFSDNKTDEFIGVTDANLARGQAYSRGGRLFVYDFDNSTGQVTNGQDLEIDNASPYGLEFSPNGRFLYVEMDYMEPDYIPGVHLVKINEGLVAQYDLLSSDIVASRDDIYHATLGDEVQMRGALQLAYDGKIYHTRRSYGALSVINNPDELSVDAAYQHAAINLNGTFPNWGLPIFIQSYFTPTALDYHDILTIPQGFSPNNDSLNDTFQIVNLRTAFPDFSIKIFNRYGTVVYEGTNTIPDWNGTTTNGNLLPTGTYFYVLKLHNSTNDLINGWVYLN
jgi:gliding motility-associated-like protein